MVAMNTATMGPANTQVGDDRTGIGNGLRVCTGETLYVDTIAESTTGTGVTISNALTAANQTLSGNLTFSGTSTKIVQPTTSLLFRDHADANTNVTITDAGAVTTRAGLTVTSGGLTVTAGGLTVTSGEIKANAGSISSGTVSTLQTGAGNGETINTAGIGVARYKAVAARTGVILQAGTYDGQTVTVINEDTTSTNSITFAVVATSNVANGVTTVINGLTGKRFVWSANATTPAWYPL